MTNNAPKVDLEFSKQLFGQMYGAVVAIEDGRKLLAEQTTRAGEAENKLKAVDEELFRKLKLLDEVKGKLEVTQRLFDERMKQAEMARQELSSVESRLAAAHSKMASILKTFTPSEKG